MPDLIKYLLPVIGYLTAAILSVCCLKRRKLPPFYKCAFYAVLSMLMEGIFDLALAADPFLDTPFSLGIFGEISACIFVFTANTAFIPKEETELKRSVSFPALVISAVFAAVTLIPVFSVGSFGVIARSILYVFFGGACVYTSAEVILNRRENPFKAGVRFFELFVLIELFVKVITVLLSSVALPEVAAVISFIGAVIISAAAVWRTVSLRKGLEPWVI